MLVLTRRMGERVRIGKDVWVTVVDSTHDRVRLGIDAPREVPIMRTELIGGREMLPEHDVPIANHDALRDGIADAMFDWLERNESAVFDMVKEVVRDVVIQSRAKQEGGSE